MDIQTRRCGILESHSTIAEAYHAWQYNPEIEKISWTSANGIRHIWRPFKKGELSIDMEEHLISLSQNYRDTNMRTDWWYKQPDFGLVLEVINDECFNVRFCNA